MKLSESGRIVARLRRGAGKWSVAALFGGYAVLTHAQTPWGACGPQDFAHVNPQPPTPLIAGSLVDTQPRPGPDILYAPLATSPQLENTGPWNAQPILISQASAYRSGEF